MIKDLSMIHKNLSIEWRWPPELDALVADPHYHKLLFENNKVRVLDVLIPAGATNNLHTHQWPATIYVLSWSHFIRYDKDGNEVMDSRKIEMFSSPPPVLWSEALPPHSIKNVGEKDIHMISVEVKL